MRGKCLKNSLNDAETQDASFEAAMQENQRLREQLRVSIEKTRAANASSLAMSSTTSNSTQQNVTLSDMFDGEKMVIILITSLV